MAETSSLPLSETPSRTHFVGDLYKQTKHTKRWVLRYFHVMGTTITYTYPNGAGCHRYDITSASTALRVHNGNAIRLTAFDKGKEEVLLLKMPKITGLSSAGNAALYDKWLSLFRATIAEACDSKASAVKVSDAPTLAKKMKCGSHGVFFPMSQTGAPDLAQKIPTPDIVSPCTAPVQGPSMTLIMGAATIYIFSFALAACA